MEELEKPTDQRSRHVSTTTNRFITHHTRVEHAHTHTGPRSRLTPSLEETQHTRGTRTPRRGSAHAWYTHAGTHGPWKPRCILALIEHKKELKPALDYWQTMDADLQVPSFASYSGIMYPRRNTFTSTSPTARGGTAPVVQLSRPACTGNMYAGGSIPPWPGTDISGALGTCCPSLWSTPPPRRRATCERKR